LQNPLTRVLLALLITGAVIITVFYERIYKPHFIYPALGVFSVVLFFSYSVVLTWDSTHYLSYLAILDGSVGLESWDLVRGPAFPLHLWLIVSVLGASVNTMLIVHYLMYASTLCLYYLIVRAIVPLNTAQRRLNAVVLIYVIAGLNPLVFGYYHVILTEYFASFSVAVIIYAAILFHKCLENDTVGWKYKLSMSALVVSFPVLYFLRQNYLMLSVGAVLAILTLALVRRSGWKNIFRTLRLLVYSLIVLAAGIFTWNTILPEIEDEAYAEYMRTRTSERMLVRIFIPDTEFILHSNLQEYLENHPGKADNLAALTGEGIDTADPENPSNMIVTFYDRNGDLIDAYIVKGVESRYHVTLSDSLSMLLRNLSKHPLLVVRGTTDAYLASINFFGAVSYDTISYNIVREVNLFRTNENSAIGYFVYYQTGMHGNVFYVSEYLYQFAEPFVHKRTAGPIVNAAFIILGLLINITFTLGFLLLPIIWVGSFVLILVRRRELVFSVTFISASVSLGYMLLNSFSRVFIDRHNFPVYISSWIAIFALAYGVWRMIAEKRKREHIEIPNGV